MAFSTKNIPYYSPDAEEDFLALPTTLTNELVSHITYNGVTYTHVNIVESLTVEAKLHLHNKKLAENNAPKWLMNAVCFFVDSFENPETGDKIKVFEEYAPKGEKKRIVPKVVSELVVQNATYLLVYGHYMIYGIEKTEINEGKCTNCGHTDAYTLYIDRFYTKREQMPLPVVFKLSNPIVFDLPKHPALEGYTFDTINFTPTSLATAVKHQDKFERNNPYAFNIATTVDHIELVDSDKNYVLSAAGKRLIETVLWEKIADRDKQKLDNAFNDLPQMFPSLQEDCTKCGERIYVSLNPLALTPRLA